MICFYHSSDLDGQCSGAIVKYMYPNCEMLPINYGQKFPWDRVQEQFVLMVDFSLQPFSDMVQLNRCAELVWIDHHETSMKEAEVSGERISGLRRNGVGACALVWEYLGLLQDLPYAVKLLAEYDVWKHDNPNTLPFQYGMRSLNTRPDNRVLWDRLLSCNKDSMGEALSIARKGDIVLTYEQMQNRRAVKVGSFPVEFEGFRALAMNRSGGSRQFESVWDPTLYDLMLTFYWSPTGFWYVGLYTDRPDVDCGALAQKHGGGGHREAAGFECEELPFVLVGSKEGKG